MYLTNEIIKTPFTGLHHKFIRCFSPDQIHWCIMLIVDFETIKSILKKIFHIMHIGDEWWLDKICHFSMLFWTDYCTKQIWWTRCSATCKL